MAQLPADKVPLSITEPLFDDEEIRQVRQALDSRWVTQGPKTAEFERLFGARHQARHAYATTSCTAALHLATMALGLGPGDEVVVPAFTWVTSAHCAEYVGAKAVFADIDLSTFNLDPAAFERAITERTRAVVAVHLFGKAAPMDEILGTARRHGIAVIEDAACATGTAYRGRPVGVIGDIGCFSLHPRKVITTGEGGMLTTNSEEIAFRVRALRNHGATGPAPGVDPTRPYSMSTFDAIGYNLRLSDIQSAVGIAQMGKLEALLAERRGRAHRYLRLLSGIEGLVLPMDDGGHTYQSFVVRLASGSRDQRNRLMDLLWTSGIQTRPGTHAAHRLGYYSRKYSIPAEAFPNAAIAEDTTITLPIVPGMSDVQQDRVVSIVREFLGT